MDRPLTSGVPTWVTMLDGYIPPTHPRLDILSYQEPLLTTAGERSRLRALATTGQLPNTPNYHPSIRRLRARHAGKVIDYVAPSINVAVPRSPTAYPEFDPRQLGAILTACEPALELDCLRELVWQLADPVILRGLLLDAMQAGEQGERHPNGFLRLPLLREGAGRERTYELRIHVWADKVNDRVYMEDIHDHRVAFATVCLAGGYDNQLYSDRRSMYETIALQDNAPLCAVRPSVTAQPMLAVKQYQPHNHFVLQPTQAAPIFLEQTVAFRSNQRYSLDPYQLHCVSNLQPGTITMTLRGVDRGRVTTRIWSSSNNTSVANCMPLSVADTLAAYQRVLEMLAK